MTKKMGFAETIAWYDANAPQYAKNSAGHFDRNHIATFMSLLPPNPKVLDAGCGAGRDADLLAKSGAHITGLDLSRGLLNIAKQHVPSATFIYGDLRKMPFEDAFFDGVWSNTSLLHMETATDVQDALNEIVRVLKPGGALHVLVKAQTTDEKTAVVTDKLSNHDRFFQYFTLTEMRTLLERAGLAVKVAKQYGEDEAIPNGRAEVQLVWCVAQKRAQKESRIQTKTPHIA